MEGRSIKFQLAIMVAVLFAVTLLRFGLSPWFGHELPFGSYVLGTIIIGWITGWHVALLSILLGSILGSVLFCKPHASLVIFDPVDVLSLGFYWMNGGIAVVVTESMRIAQRRVKRVSLNLVDQQHELNSRMKQQEVVGRLGELAITCDTPKGFLEEVTKILSETLFVEYAKVLQVVDEKSLILVAGTGWKKGTIGTKIGRHSQSGYTLRVKEPVVVEDLANETRFKHPNMLASHGVRSGVSCAIPGPNGPWGVLGIHSSKPRLFSVHDVAFVQAVAGLIAACIERHRLTKELRDRISDRDRLTKELQKRVAALADADRQKDDFMAMLAHELRNPLAPIQNCTSILSMDVDAETVQWALDTMQRQVQHMVRLVDDLLDVSRSLRGRIDLKKEVHDLQSVLFRAIETAKPVIESQGHRFTFTPPPWPVNVEVDEVRMAQVISNLLNNAAKYTPFNGTIELSAQVEGDQVTVKVTDNGCGIEEDLLLHIFDPFVQADRSLDRSKGGLGIGLALVRSLVEMHSGRVGVASTVGVGSTFSVTLPVSRADASSDEIPVYTKKGHISQKILVVDDNADAARTLATMLKLDGHQAQFVFDGAAALEAVPKFEPDIILLDIGLPEMNGYEVCQRIRQIPAGRDVCIVALTGYGTQEHRDKAFASGFSDHLVKPVQYDTLQNLFDQVCGTTKKP